MAITPQTNIKLLSVPLALDNTNQLTFDNKEVQFNYFNNLPKIEIDNCTYQRKDNIIRFPAHIDNLWQFNYCIYQNEAYTDKWFYAFITDMSYVNDNMTEITIKTDVWQTWQFDLQYKRMFVEREMVVDDSVGLHTIPENLELGEYIIDVEQYYSGLDDLKYIIQTTEYTNGEKPLATNFGGIYSAGGAYICDNISQVVSILQGLATEEGAESAVFAIYMCPSFCINNTSGTLQYSGQDSPLYDNFSFNKPSSLNGYTPRNKKLLTFPYCGINFTNNNGSSNILQYELFNTSNCQFNIKGVPSVGASIKCMPYNYKNSGENNNEEEGLMAGKFPTLSWSEDAYTNWLTQNSVNIGIGLASDLLSIIGGAGLMATGGGSLAGASSVINGGLAIANDLAQVYQHSLTPNSAKGNTNGGDINVCSGRNGFYFYQFSIKQEYAKIIDDYFSMYGYKVNSLKVPNIKTRNNWNYIKTVNSNIIGNIPQNDLQEIKKMFDDGITLWHNPNTFLDYSQGN